MKNSFIIYIILILSGFVINSVSAQITKASIRATGLTCSMCSNAINKQLKSIPAVSNVETDLNTNTFTVTLQNNNFLSPRVFKEKVEKAGFFVGSLVVTIDAQLAQKSPYQYIEQSASKEGLIDVQVLDKGYVTEKEYKKLVKKYKDIPTYLAEKEEDFHIKSLNE